MKLLLLSLILITSQILFAQIKVSGTIDEKISSKTEELISQNRIKKDLSVEIKFIQTEDAPEILSLDKDKRLEISYGYKTAVILVKINRKGKLVDSKVLEIHYTNDSEIPQKSADAIKKFISKYLA